MYAIHIQKHYKHTMPQANERISPIYQALEELGVSELERKLYTISLALGPINISTLAERMGISRPNIYKVIRGLEAHGLATFGGGRTYIKSFQVESPSVVVERLRTKRKELGALDESLSAEVANLLAKYDQGKLPAKVRVLKGRKEFTEAYVQVFEEADQLICYFGSYADFLREISPELGEKRIERRVERKVSIRALVLPSPEAELLRKKDEVELRETRYLVGGAPFESSFYLFANKAIFWQPMTPIAVMVEDKYLVAMWQSMFELLWDKNSE